MECGTKTECDTYVHISPFHVINIIEAGKTSIPLIWSKSTPQRIWVKHSTSISAFSRNGISMDETE